MVTTLSAQTEKEILELSLEKFRWKTTKQFDLLADLFDDDLVFVHITGHVTTKEDWIKPAEIRQVCYNKLEPKDASEKFMETRLC